MRERGEAAPLGGAPARQADVGARVNQTAQTKKPVRTSRTGFPAESKPRALVVRLRLTPPNTGPTGRRLTAVPPIRLAPFGWSCRSAPRACASRRPAASKTRSSLESLGGSRCRTPLTARSVAPPHPSSGREPIRSPRRAPHGNRSCERPCRGNPNGGCLSLSVLRLALAVLSLGRPFAWPSLRFVWLALRVPSIAGPCARLVLETAPCLPLHVTARSFRRRRLSGSFISNFGSPCNRPRNDRTGDVAVAQQFRDAGHPAGEAHRPTRFSSYSQQVANRAAQGQTTHEGMEREAVGGDAVRQRRRRAYSRQIVAQWPQTSPAVAPGRISISSAPWRPS